MAATCRFLPFVKRGELLDLTAAAAAAAGGSRTTKPAPKRALHLPTSKVEMKWMLFSVERHGHDIDEQDEDCASVDNALFRRPIFLCQKEQKQLT